MKRLFCIILLGSVYIFSINISAFTIIGNVCDPDGNPIEFANITIYSISDTTFINGGITDKSGNYSVETLNSDSCFFKCSFIGYKPFLSIASTENKNINIVLAHDIFALQEVSVKAHAPVSKLTARGILTNVSIHYWALWGQRMTCLTTFRL